MEKKRALEQHSTTVFGFSTTVRLRRSPSSGVKLVELVDEKGICYYSLRTSRVVEVQTRALSGAAAIAAIEAWLQPSFRIQPVPSVFGRPGER